MRKYLISIFLLIILDYCLANYLKQCIDSLKAYEFKYNKKPLIYQKNEIIVNDISQIDFDDYFEILDFNEKAYKYYFDENLKQIKVKLNNNDKNYYFEYKLIEPEIIKETEYITETVYVDRIVETIDNNNSDDEVIEYEDYVDNNIYYSCDYYEFNLGTDLSSIIYALQDDIVSYTNVTCDYSCLNPYEIGEYPVYFYNDYQKIEKIVKII